MAHHLLELEEDVSRHLLLLAQLEQRTVNITQLHKLYVHTYIHAYIHSYIHIHVNIHSTTIKGQLKLPYNKRQFHFTTYMHGNVHYTHTYIHTYIHT